MVFSEPVGGGTPRVLASFNGVNGNGPNSLILSGGTLYGTCGSSSRVFSLPLAGGNITTVAAFNGSNDATPTSNLILSGGAFYGSTVGGGAYNNGTMFSVPETGGTINVLASFGGSNGTWAIRGPTMDANGNLWGTTDEGGGVTNEGTVYELVAAVPEPASLSLLAVGGIGLLARRRRRTAES